MNTVNKGFFDHPVVIVLAGIGVTDFIVQAATNGEIRIIHIILESIFG